MAAGSGKFVWYELMTSDVEAARAFYAKVVGWTIEDSGMPGVQYLLAKVGDHAVAGMMTFPPDMPRRPVGWVGYVAVDDVDASAERVRTSGGTVHRPPSDIPGVGRFAAVADPQGAVFMLFHGAGEAPPSLPPGTAGDVGWHELHTTDWSAALAFYQQQFGWEKAYGHDMGEMGMYQTFNIDGAWAGGMMNSPAASPPIPPHWSYYFNVDGIDAAVARIAEAGGTLQHGPHEVPGGSFIAIATDPQGGWFALTARSR